MPSERHGSRSPWSPLRQRVFRALWIASVASNVGTWMQNVAAAWLMTSLAPSPSMVALVRAATTLPVFLLALLAGALADVVDRRRLLLITQSWMLLAAASLGVLTIIGATTPWVLLALTFAVGIGVAMNGPVWQASIPELVSRDDLHAAVALNGVGFNLARAVGPALGGVIVATAGSGAVFLINAASFVGVVIVLYRWPRAPRKTQFPTEDVLGAMRAGLRYVRHAPDLPRFSCVPVCSFFAAPLSGLFFRSWPEANWGLARPAMACCSAAWARARSSAPPFCRGFRRAFVAIR